MVFDHLKWGADWLSSMVEENAEQTVFVGYEGNLQETTASLVDESGRVLPGPASIVTEHTKFLFESAKFATLGLTIKRGMLIRWDTQYYEIVQDGNKWWTYNDPFKRKFVVAAKHVTITTS